LKLFTVKSILKYLVELHLKDKSILSRVLQSSI